MVTLSKEKFGLNIIIISTKYQQCQITKHICLRKSPSPDINYIHQAIAKDSIQVDEFRDLRDIIRSVRAKQIKKISKDLQNQGYTIKQIWSLSNDQLKKLCIDIRHILPLNIYNFMNRYINNTSATLKNMVM